MPIPESNAIVTTTDAFADNSLDIIADARGEKKPLFHYLGPRCATARRTNPTVSMHSRPVARLVERTQVGIARDPFIARRGRRENKRKTTNACS